MNIPSYETLLVEVLDHVATVWLNRPDKANSMNAPLWAEVQQCFEWLDCEPSIRVIVLAGKGRHFCSGIDLSMFAQVVAAQGTDSALANDPARASEQLRLVIKRLQANLSAIENCRKPVLAAVQGACVGGGLELIACCDMRYATSSAIFSIKEIDVGMTADVGALQRLPHWMPAGVVRELAYTGRTMDAGEAQVVGLVNRVYPDQDALLAGVAQLAAQIAAKSPIAVRGVKQMLLYTRDHSVSDGLEYVATWNSGMLSQQDVMASVSAAASPEAPDYDE
jgi:enoyl-CoA hydratase